MSTAIPGRTIPYAISEYIKKQYHEDFLFAVKDYKRVQGQWEYIVEVSKDDYIHTLRFDEQGVLLKDDADPAFPADLHDGPLPEDIPE